MPSENNSEVHYELFEDKKSIKFMDSHSEDEKFIRRIHGKYYQLAVDPYKEAESSFRSRKCPKCKKTFFFAEYSPILLSVCNSCFNKLGS